MGQINFEAWKTKQNAVKTNSTTKQTTTTAYAKTDKPYVGYFTLKNDKDYAIVRIMHDSPADFDMVTGHRVTVNDKLRMVNCLREDINDPVEKCPLCATGKKTEDKIYIHLIEYSIDAQGQIIATPKVWERSANFADTLINKINDYGPLSDVIFKVIRNGEAGSKKTSYDLNFMNPAVYRPEIYQKKSELFEGYKAVGTAVLNYGLEKLTGIASNIASYNNNVKVEEVTPRNMNYDTNNNDFTTNTININQQAQTTTSTIPTYELPKAQSQTTTVTPPTSTITSNNDTGVVRPQRRYYN